MKPAFVGGSLSFKGEKKAKKKKSKAKHTLQQKDREESDTVTNKAVTEALESDLTDAERKALKRRKERERQELAVIAQKSHRERVEEFNEKLASVTEHNDIPRVEFMKGSCHMRGINNAPSAYHRMHGVLAFDHFEADASVLHLITGMLLLKYKADLFTNRAEMIVDWVDTRFIPVQNDMLERMHFGTL